jgi:dienelactone hydrolase
MAQEIIGMGKCCLSGKLHDGWPVGKVETVDNLPTYITVPPDGSKAKSIIFITDSKFLPTSLTPLPTTVLVFGYEFKNVRLLADQYAKAGFYCYIPDLFDGDALPIDFLQSVEPPMKVRENLSMIEKAKNAVTVGATLGPWMLKHREAIVQPQIDSFIRAVKSVPGTGKVGVIGFCWGGRYAILAAAGNADASYACHPSLLTLPADLEVVQKPLSLAVGEKDSLLDDKQIGTIMEVLGKKTTVPHEIIVYEGQVHGFAIRGDWSSDADKKAMDDAIEQGVQWFGKYLT